MWFVLNHVRNMFYEVLSQHRLESLDSIRKDFSRLTYYFSQEGIEKLKRNCNLEDYNAQREASWFQTCKRLAHMEGFELVRNVEETWWRRAISPQYKRVLDEK